MTTYARVEYDQYTTTSHEADPNDSWDRDSTESDYYPTGFHTVPQDRYHDIALSFTPEPGRGYYLVWAHYSTGDSFGFDDAVEWVDIFQTPEAAHAASKALEDRPVHNHTGKYTRDNGIEIDIHVPWDGYFEHLCSMNVSVIHWLGHQAT